MSHINNIILLDHFAPDINEKNDVSYCVSFILLFTLADAGLYLPLVSISWCGLMITKI